MKGFHSRSGAVNSTMIIIAALLTSGMAGSLVIGNVDEIQETGESLFGDILSDMLNGFEIVSIYLHTDGHPTVVDRIKLTVRTGPGCEAIALNDTVIEISTGSGVLTLVIGESTITMDPIIDDDESIQKGILDENDLTSIFIDIFPISSGLTAGKRVHVNIIHPHDGETKFGILLPEPLAYEWVRYV